MEDKQLTNLMFNYYYNYATPVTYVDYSYTPVYGAPVYHTTWHSWYYGPIAAGAFCFVFLCICCLKMAQGDSDHDGHSSHHGSIHEEVIEEEIIYENCEPQPYGMYPQPPQMQDPRYMNPGYEQPGYPQPMGFQPGTIPYNPNNMV